MRPPRYPPIAIREHHSGKVILKVLIGIDGSPKEVTVEKSSGYRELDQAAIAAAKTWIFNPGTRNGKPYEGYALVPIDFNLNEL
jgi:protein TonB